MSSFFSKQCIALLFPLKSETDGHWIGVWIDTTAKIVHHFDSYGFGPAAESKFSSNPGVSEGLLAEFYTLCQHSGYQVIANSVAYQQWSKEVNTCGRHVITRLRFHYLTDAEYERLMKHQSLSPDEIVTMLTFLALDEDETDHAKVVRDLGGDPGVAGEGEDGVEVEETGMV